MICREAAKPCASTSKLKIFKLETAKAGSFYRLMIPAFQAEKIGNAWAFLGNPTYQNGTLKSAELLYFDTDKAKVTEQLKAHERGHYAMFYFGTVNSEQAYLRF